jgi:hypothetical protein
MEPTPEVMATPTGIPPHVELACQMKEILNTVSEIFINLKDQTTEIIEAVKTAIDEKSWDLGHVTGTRLQEILTSFQEESMGAVNSRLDRIRAEFHRIAGGAGDEEDNLNNFEVEGEETQGTQRQPACRSYLYVQ